MPRIRIREPRRWPKLALPSSVRGRIITGFGLLVLILIVVVAGSAWMARQHRSALAQMEARSEIADALEDAALNCTLANLLLERYLVTGNEAVVPGVRSSVTQAADDIAQARALEESRGREGTGAGFNEAEAARLDELAAGVATLSETFERVIALRQAGDAEGARQALEAAVPAITESGIAIGEAADLERQEVPTLRSRADRTGKLAFWFALVSGAAGALIGLAASAFIARSILRPLSSLEATAVAVAEGDLEARAPATGLRELARLGASLNRMTESLLDASKRRELEEALRESEERFRTLAETTTAAIFIYQGAEIRYGNAAAEAITGYSREEWLGMNFWNLIHPDFRELARERGMARQRGKEVPTRYEIKILTKESQERWLDFTAEGIDYDGKPSVLGTAVDITERKRAEAALRESEEKFRGLLESAPDAIVTVNGDGRIVLVNAQTEATFGYRREELLGQPVEILVPERFREVHVGHRTGYYSEPRTRPLSSGLEAVGRRKDGSEFPVAISLSPQQTKDGVLVTSIIRDITELKRAEEALRESEESYRELFENANDIVYTHDLAGQFTSINRAAEEVIGYARDEALKMNIAQVVAPEYLAGAREMIRRKLEEGVRTTHELEIIAKDGRRVPLEVSTRLIFHEGKPVGVQGIARDITERKQAEEALRESEERYRLLADNVTDVIWTRDLNLRLTYISPSVTRQRGPSVEEAMAENLEDILTPASLDLARKTLAEELAKENADHKDLSRSRTLELEMIRKDGSKIWTEVTVTFLRDEDSRPVGILGITRDITERKQAEAQVRESEEKFRGLLESAPDAIVTVNSDGHIVLVNTQTENMFGYSRDELLGRPIEMFVPERLRNAHVGHRAGYHSEPRTRSMDAGLELTARRKDGSEFPVAISLSPQKTKDGVLVTSIIRDITEHKRAEEELRKLSRAVEQSPSIVLITSTDGRIEYVNPRFTQVTGYTLQEVFGKKPRVLKSDKTSPERFKRLWKSITSGGEWRGELLNRKKNGELYWVTTSISPIRDPNGTITHFLGVQEDITKRKQAEEELKRLNQELKADRKAIEKLNRSLEEKVRERTRELSIANEELRERNRQLLDARAQAATDALTGLSNHRAFHERVREEVLRSQETGSPVGLIMLDIDSFKRVNDSRGHLAGDEILRALAQTIAAVAPQEDAYRYGGDEFAVLLPGVEPRKTTRIAERLRRAVERRMDGSGETVTVSLGVASFPDMVASAEELIYGADAAMYWAKSAGKNRVGDWSKLVNGRAKGALPWYAADRGVKAPDVVAALLAALAAKDPVTAAHTERCSWYAAKLAEELGLGEKDASIVRLASLLHDIGKLAVPDEVLFKPGPLNDEEWAQMKQHSTAALHVLSQIRTIADATPAILHHHEHFDGSGYPDGLAADEIPTASRILLVTDAFDAMTTDRPYRKAMPVESAVEELKRNSGSQFDPSVVDAFLQVLTRHGPRPLHFPSADRGRPTAVCAGGPSASGGAARRRPRGTTKPR